MPTSILYLGDPPTSRSLHSRERSRSGGIAIAAAILVGGGIATLRYPLPHELLIIPVAAAVIFAISLLDDIKDVFCVYRITLHLYAASLLLVTPVTPFVLYFPGLAVSLDPGTTLVVVVIGTSWMINLYNFMDGMDGFAAGMSLFGFATLSYLGWQSGEVGYAVGNSIVAAAAAGFLILNRPPAALFMGDSGACLLGFCAAVSSLLGQRLMCVPFWMSLLIWSPFLVDATLTLVGRALRLEKVWIGQRNHSYHKLLLRWGHTRTVAHYYLVMAACCGTALLLRDSPANLQWAGLACWAAFYAASTLLISSYARRTPILQEMVQQGDDTA